jgi:site-specific recombinase XerD
VTAPHPVHLPAAAAVIRRTGGVDVVAIKAAMGHRALATTTRYLHARPATDQAAIFTRALSAGSAEQLAAV